MLSFDGSGTPWRYCLLTALLTAGIGGCSSKASVSGKVTYQGRHVTHGSVIVVSADSSARSAAIHSDGSFTIGGLPPGKARLGVVSRDPAKGRSIFPREAAVGSLKTQGKRPQKVTVNKEWFPLPSNLEDPATSGLVYTVVPGPMHWDLNLK